jgi:DNA-binding CsgD family transcriptional regulator/PAS domain-containing protein
VSQTPEARALPLIELIYRAAVVSDVWTEFLQALSDELDAPSIGLNLEIPGAPTTRRVYRVNSPERFGRVFAEFAMRGEIPWDLSKVSGSRFHPGSELYPDEELTKTDFYREYMEPQGLATPLGCAMGRVDGVLVATIGIYPRRLGRRLMRPDLEMLDLLAPHLSQAYQIHRRLRSDDQYRQAATEVIDRLPTGVIFVDESGKVVTSNRAAQRIIALNDGLTIREGTPYATVSGGNTSFEELLVRALRPPAASDSRSQVLSINRPSGRRAFPTIIEHLQTAELVANSLDAVAAIFVTDPEYQHEGMQNHFANLYGLTAAETKLSLLLSEGKTLEEAAAQRGVTLHTAHNQLGRVFSKTSTSCEEDLVRLIVTGGANVRDSQES